MKHTKRLLALLLALALAFTLALPAFARDYDDDSNVNIANVSESPIMRWLMRCLIIVISIPAFPAVLYMLISGNLTLRQWLLLD